LLGRTRRHGWRRHARRPNKAAALQPLGIEREPKAVMPENFDQVTTRPAKYEEIADERIASKRLLHLQGEPVHAATHVGASDCEPHPHARRNRDHRFLRTSSTRFSVRPSKLDPTRTRKFSNLFQEILDRVTSAGTKQYSTD